MATVKQVIQHGEMTGEFALPSTATVMVPYLVEFTDQSAIPGEASLASGVPAFGDLMGNLTLQRKNVRQVEKDHRRFIVECQYTLPVPGTEPAPETPSEDRWNIQIDITTQKAEQEIQKDVVGNLLQSSAYDPITGVMVLRSDERIVIAFTTDTPDWEGIDACFGTNGFGCTNSAAVTLTINGVQRVLNAHTLHFAEYTLSTTMDVTGRSFSRMTYTLEWRADGWARKIFDKGLNRLGTLTIGGTPTLGPMAIMEKVPVYDETTGTLTNGPPRYQPISVPQFLSGGKPLAVGAEAECIPPNTISGSVIYEEVDIGDVLLWDIAVAPEPV